MFSDMPREHYKEELAQHREGVLDIIQRAGINVLWNDNDGGCKGACDRVPHQNVTALNLPVSASTANAMTKCCSTGWKSTSITCRVMA